MYIHIPILNACCSGYMSCHECVYNHRAQGDYKPDIAQVGTTSKSCLYNLMKP